jgi:hypothetical protein
MHCGGAGCHVPPASGNELTTSLGLEPNVKADKVIAPRVAHPASQNG